MKPNLLSMFTALVAAMLSLAHVLAAPAPAQAGRTQRLAGSNAVPEGLAPSEWSSIRQQDEHHHVAFPMDGTPLLQT